MSRVTMHLLNIWDLRCEALGDLGDDFLDQGLVLHGLAGFHDTNYLKIQYGGVKTRHCISCSPDDGSLNNIFTVLINRLQDIC